MVWPEWFAGRTAVVFTSVVTRVVYRYCCQSGSQVGWPEWFTGVVTRVVHRWCGQSGSQVGWPEWFTGVVARVVHR